MNGHRIELIGHYTGRDLFGWFIEEIDLVVAWHLKRIEFPGAL